MRRFADSASVPRLATVQAARRDGVTGWAGYLDSPYDTHSWGGEALSTILAELGALLPVYVAPFPAARLHEANPAADVSRLLRSLGTIRGAHVVTKPTVVLDVEAEVWSANPAGVLHYFGEFMRAVDGHVDVAPYSSPSCLIGLGQHFHIPHVWAGAWALKAGRFAGWPRTVAPYGLGAAWEAARAWQIAGNVKRYGMLVDLNVADEGVPFLVHTSAPKPPAATPIARPAPKPVVVDTIAATVTHAGKTYRGNLTAV